VKAIATVDPVIAFVLSLAIPFLIALLDSILWLICGSEFMTDAHLWNGFYKIAAVSVLTCIFVYQFLKKKFSRFPSLMVIIGILPIVFIAQSYAYVNFIYMLSMFS
jgi:hypothetical protein